MIMNFTKEEIQDNRKAWIAYLREPARKKAIGLLDIGNGARCCLGHYAYLMHKKYAIERTSVKNVDGQREFRYDGRNKRLTTKLAESLGIDEYGYFKEYIDFSDRAVVGEGYDENDAAKVNALARLNDITNLTLSEIADFIEKGFEKDLFLKDCGVTVLDEECND